MEEGYESNVNKFYLLYKLIGTSTLKQISTTSNQAVLQEPNNLINICTGVTIKHNLVL